MCGSKQRIRGAAIFFSLTPTIIRGLVVWKRRIWGEWAAFFPNFGDSQT